MYMQTKNGRESKKSKPQSQYGYFLCLSQVCKSALVGYN